ncbi:hypothetical protein AB0C13_32840 [Streptomyces sp. NPDC049099]|uniref:hypothetical protein n=1 Tax=Streptomyces sp. NPDC049099 TaxID=3155768 RepID=UPI00341A019B
MSHFDLNDPWVTTVGKSLAYLVFAPLLLRGLMVAICEKLHEAAPWKEGRLLSFLPYKIKADKFPIDRNVRKALAVARLFGHPLKVSHVTLRSEVTRAKSSQSALSVWFNVFPAVPLLLTFIFSVSVFATKPSFARDFVYLTAREIAFSIGFYFAYRAAFGATTKWMQENKDLASLDACVDALIACGKCRQGVGSIVEVDRYVTVLCGQLGAFAVDGSKFLDLRKRSALSKHVRQVQNDLLQATDVLLQVGPHALEGIVERVATILDRICEQRWLRLLDLLDAGASDSASPPTTDSRDGRDAWVVLGGSLAAAVTLGASGAFGVPLGAVVPAAVVLMLGPATVWGSSRLSMSPRGLLQSMSGALTSAPTGGAADSQRSSEGGPENGSA